MIILGIDPGIATLGYGVLEADKGKFLPVDYGVVTTPKGVALPKRLEMLEEADDLQEILEELPEDVVQDIIRDGRSYLENFVHDYTYRKIYSYEASLVLRRWGYLALFALIYALAAVVSLEFIDRDKR